jgi:hypothetical protein
MILIAHRGNINGINKPLENYPGYIYTALEAGFHVEIDVRLVDGKLFLGHDTPQFPVDINFLKNEKLLCHAKNREAFELMLMHENIHSFWHQEDEYTLTSKRIPVVYPGKPIIKNSIVMVRDYYNELDVSNCYGVCSDYVGIYKR